MAEIVDRIPELPRAGDGFKLHGLGMKSEIDARDVYRFLRFKSRSQALHSTVAVRQVDPIVESPARTADLHLRMSRRKSIEPDFTDIGNVVTIGVREVHDLSFGAGEDASAECHQAVTELQMRSKHRAFVHATVAVNVFQQHDLRQWRGRRIFRADRVICVLDDKHPSQMIKIDRHRICDDRLRSDKLNSVAGFDLKACLGFFWRLRRFRGLIDPVPPALLAFDRLDEVVTARRRLEQKGAKDHQCRNNHRRAPNGQSQNCIGLAGTHSAKIILGA